LEFGAVIVTLLNSVSGSSSVLGQHSTPGVNEWLMIRNSFPEFFRWLPIGRFYSRLGSGDRPAGGDESHKRQYRGNPDLYGHKGFFAAVTTDHKKVLMSSMNEEN